VSQPGSGCPVALEMTGVSSSEGHPGCRWTKPEATLEMQRHAKRMREYLDRKPFGDLFGFDVIVDRSLSGSHEIAFNAGNHRDLIRMAYADFDRLVRPKVLSFGLKRKTTTWEVDTIP